MIASGCSDFRHSLPQLRSRTGCQQAAPQNHGIPENLLVFSCHLTNRVSTAAMIPMAAKFNRLSPWKKGRPMIDILLLCTTAFVATVVLLVFPPPTANASY